MPLRPEIWTGTLLDAGLVLPVPNSPSPLLPHAQTLPSDFSASVLVLLAAIAVTPAIESASGNTA